MESISDRNETSFHKVLIVDDEMHIRRSFSALLEHVGHGVETAADFEEGEKLLHSTTFSVVLCDIYLQGRSGIDFLQTCIDIQPDTPLVLITGNPSLETAQKAIRLGAYDYLTKPIQSERLFHVIDRAAELRSLRENKRLAQIERTNYQKNLEEQIKIKTRELRKSEIRYRRLFKQSRDAIIMTSLDRRIIDFNQAAIDLFGFTAGELKNKHVFQLYVHEDDRIDFERRLRQSGALKDFESFLKKKDGSVITCLFTSSLRTGVDGALSGYQSILRDVTEQRRAEARIKDQNQFLGNVIESFSQPLLVIDPADFTIIIANSATRLQEDPSDNKCYSLFHGLSEPCSRFGYACPVEEVNKTGRKCVVKQTHPIGDPDAGHFEVFGAPVFDHEGRMINVIACYQDVSDNVRAQQDLQRLGTAIEQSGDGIIITDSRGIVQYVNTAFESISGYPREEAVGEHIRTYHERVESEKRTAVFHEIMQRVSMGESWHGTFKNSKKDGTRFEEEIKISPVKNELERITNFVAVLRDVTHQKRLESIAEAVNLMDNIGYIFSGIRHEIGNPLNSVKVALSLLQKNVGSYSREKIADFVTDSLSEIGRVEYLLKALRNFSLFETPDLKKMRLHDFLTKFLSLAKGDFRKRGIEIKTRLSVDSDWIRADQRILHHILLNLFTNAADALQGREDPRITIDSRPSPGYIELKVIDNGRGMSEEDLGKLFNPFFTTKPHGTGLGLVIVKKLLSKMNISIRVESQRNVGTAVTILIPAVGEPEAGRG
ncbi:MAG: PAS domain S-box protein, partial [Desulfobacterales bacterium]|nr:PAS domain S-box protein [Desulfobacterales bacterium]